MTSIEGTFGRLAMRLLMCVWLCMALPAHAVIAETEANDIFSDLSDVTNSPDFSQAEIGVNDTFRAAIGILPELPDNIFVEDAFRANDLDWWEFDLHIGTTFFVTLAEVPNDVADYFPGVLLYKEREGQLFPVASNGLVANLRNFINFSPWENGHYYLGVSAVNNVPLNMTGANLRSSAFHATPIAPFTLPLASFSGGGGSSFIYDIEFQGVFAPTTSAVPIPPALWMFVSGLFSFALFKRKSANSAIGA